MTKNVALCLIGITKVGVLFYGISLAVDNKMSIAIVLLVYSYFDKMINNVTDILDHNIIVQNSKVSMDRVLKLEEYSQDSRYNYIKDEINKGIIDFDNVLYGNKQDPILNHFSCQNWYIRLIT